MSSEVLVRKWKTWRVLAAGTEDTALAAGLKRSILPTLPDSRIIKLHPEHGLILKFWGQNAENETFTARLSGWMENGPGQVLFSAACILGATSIAEAPIDDKGKWADGTWFAVDDITLSLNPCGAAVGEDATLDTIIAVPTMGFTTMVLELTGKDGTTGVEAMTAGCAYRELPIQQIHDMIPLLNA